MEGTGGATKVEWVDPGCGVGRFEHQADPVSSWEQRPLQHTHPGNEGLRERLWAVSPRWPCHLLHQLQPASEPAGGEGRNE